MQLQAFAKINLTLDILGKRGDGYHELATVYQHISLADIVTVTPNRSGEVEVTCSLPELSGQGNLCHRAALLMKERFGIGGGISVHIEKRIPLGAGLSGGSADAAAVLRGMALIYDRGMKKEALHEVAVRLGMDVPFHLTGGTCLGTGRGEMVKQLAPLPQYHAVIVFPGFPVSTPRAYAALEYGTTGKAGSTMEFMKRYDVSRCHNDFEQTVFRLHPELKELKKLMGKGAHLSGSGSSLFRLFKNADKALAYSARLTEMGITEVYMAHTMNRTVAMASAMGFCGGVRRALEGVEIINDKKGVHVLGKIVHNDQVVDRLKKKGIRFVADHREVASGTIVVSAHGAPRNTISAMERRGLSVKDLTCPVILKIKGEADRERKNGKRIVIYGDAAHPEVKGLAADLPSSQVTMDAEKVEAAGDLLLISQTTVDLRRFRDFTAAVKRRCDSVTVKETVCAASRERQQSAMELAKRSDIIIVAGGTISSNTRRLAEICAASCETHLVESAEKIDPRWFLGKERVGITAGASTPDWIIESVRDTVLMML